MPTTLPTPTMVQRLERFTTPVVRVVKRRPGTRWMADTLADGAVVRQALGSPYFDESRLDELLDFVSAHGYWLETRDRTAPDD